MNNGAQAQAASGGNEQTSQSHVEQETSVSNVDTKLDEGQTSSAVNADEIRRIADEAARKAKEQAEHGRC